MNSQEAFDIVIRGLRKQGRRSEDRLGLGTCLYRGPGGTKCAFGFLIPDELYKPSMEGKSASSAVEQFPELWDIVRWVAAGLIGSLQTVHDTMPLEEWENEWQRLAEKYGLTVPPLTTQESFSMVVRALRKQGARSIGDDGKCLYRGPNGWKCAAGHIIPDALYSKEMEQKSVAGLVGSGVWIPGNVPFPDLAAYWADAATKVLLMLQHVHDDNTDIGTWERQFTIIAERFNLELPPA